MTEQNPCTWRDLQLVKEQFEKELVALRTQIAQQHAANETRLSAMNEIREAMRDQSRTFITRGEASANVEAVAKVTDILRGDTNTISKALATMQGKADQGAVNIATYIALAGIGISVLAIMIGLLGK